VHTQTPPISAAEIDGSRHVRTPITTIIQTFQHSNDDVTHAGQRNNGVALRLLRFRQQLLQAAAAELMSSSVDAVIQRS
jgi:hypothetical protein